LASKVYQDIINILTVEFGFKAQNLVKQECIKRELNPDTLTKDELPLLIVGLMCTISSMVTKEKWKRIELSLMHYLKEE